MNNNEFLLEQYRSLRHEISSTKLRLFLIVALGAILVPGLTILSELESTRFVGPLVPFVVLVLTIMFVADEQALMRCGRYIRENIEPNFEETGWENWLESQRSLRVLDRCLAGCFVLTFFVFYAVSSGIAIERLWSQEDIWFSGETLAMCGGVAYGVGALWMFYTVLHHWRSATSTS